MHVITMISGFLTSVISSSRPRQHIEERLTLIIDFTIFYSGFFSSEAFDKRTNRVSTDVADKHARYISEDCYLVRRSREGQMNEPAIMAHIVASITVFVNAPPLYLPRRQLLQNARIALMPCLSPREWRQQVMFFWHLHVLPQ